MAYLDVYVVSLLLAGKIRILDRHPVHRTRAVQALLHRHQARYVDPPPYPSERNPSEEAWSKVTHVLKREKARTVDHLRDTLHRAAKSITSSDAQGYFQACRGLSSGNRLKLKTLYVAESVDLLAMEFSSAAYLTIVAYLVSTILLVYEIISDPNQFWEEKGQITFIIAAMLGPILAPLQGAEAGTASQQLWTAIAWIVGVALGVIGAI